MSQRSERLIRGTCDSGELLQGQIVTRDRPWWKEWEIVEAKEWPKGLLETGFHFQFTLGLSLELPW